LVEQPSQTMVNRRRPSLGRSLGLPPLASYMAIKADSSALLAEVAGSDSAGSTGGAATA
jgi:hypothetical protein